MDMRYEIKLGDYSYGRENVSNTPLDPNDRVEIRIRYLVNFVNSHDRNSLIYQVPMLVEAAKNPQNAKRNSL